MIKTKKDLKNYIYLDRKANFISIKSLKDLINLYLFNDIAIFLLLLRKCEYYKSKSGLISKIIYFYYKIKFKKKVHKTWIYHSRKCIWTRIINSSLWNNCGKCEC